MSTDEVHDQSEIMTMANAFKEVANTIQSTHKVFLKMATIIPALLVLFMCGLASVIMWFVYVQCLSLSEQNMATKTKLESLPNDVAKAIQIHQTQSVFMNGGEGNPVKDLAREILEKGNADERLRDMGKPAISSTGSH